MLLITLLIIFIIYTILIVNCPMITSLDRLIISFIQDKLDFVPIIVPQMFDCVLYSLMIVSSLVVCGIYLLLKKKYFDILYLFSIPLVTYGIGTVLKHIVQRPRPPVEFFINVNPDGFSYVSNHTLISFCLCLMVIYYLAKSSLNKILKIILASFVLFWVLSIGFSRIWLGVHNPTDVLGAYILGIILVIISLKIRTFFEKYIGL